MQLNYTQFYNALDELLLIVCKIGEGSYYICEFSAAIICK